MTAASTTSRITEQVRVGRLLRRNFRALLDTHGATYTEHTGLLDSIFVVTADAATWQAILAAQTPRTR